MKPVTILHDAGAIFGLTNLIDERLESIVDAVALTDIICHKIPISELRSLFKTNSNFENFCYKKTLYQFLHIYEPREEYSKYSSDE